MRAIALLILLIIASLPTYSEYTVTKAKYGIEIFFTSAEPSKKMHLYLELENTTTFKKFAVHLYRYVTRYESNTSIRYSKKQGSILQGQSHLNNGFEYKYFLDENDEELSKMPFNGIINPSLKKKLIDIFFEVAKTDHSKIPDIKKNTFPPKKIFGRLTPYTELIGQIIE